MSNDMKLKGRVAIVTGAARGIGVDVATALAKEGANIVVNYSKSRDKAVELAKNLQKLNVEAAPIKADVRNWDEVKTMVNQTVEKFGRVDVLYNNAGVLHRVMPEELTPEMWDECIDVNLKGAFLCTKAVAEPMKKQLGGRIINVASLAGFLAFQYLDYSASKGGIIALTKGAAEWLAPYGILVNAVCPGIVETEMGLTNPHLKRIKSQTPMGRLAQPQDIANAVVYLARDATFVSGHVLVVDGGISNVYYARD
jgi:3-oxoacyl-[acyl-carrier protein] reductase